MWFWSTMNWFVPKRSGFVFASELWKYEDKSVSNSEVGLATVGLELTAISRIESGLTRKSGIDSKFTVESVIELELT